MSESNQHLEDLKSIRNIMERSSRFISLSGWSGVAAGVCALVGAYFGHEVIRRSVLDKTSLRKQVDVLPGLMEEPLPLKDYMGSQLMQIAMLTLLAALVTSFLFTWMRNRKTGAPLWNPASRRLVISIAIPLAVGGLYLVKLMQAGAFGLIAPGCLLFYGLALVSASRFTLGEIKYLGYLQLITGSISLFFPGSGLYFWAFGFGILHIFYGIVMWWKYERPTT